MNNNQRELFDQMLYDLMLREHDLWMPDIAAYCRTKGVSTRDEQQIYTYLYGVHEGIRFHANDEVTTSRARMMMAQMDIAVELCDASQDRSIENFERYINRNSVPCGDGPYEAPDWMHIPHMNSSSHDMRHEWEQWNNGHQ